MKICVLGDSLSFGRPKYNINPADTWPYKLCEVSSGKLTLRSRGGARARDLASDVDQLSNYYPNGYFDLTVVQVGIVDVTPRLLTPRARRLLELTNIGREMAGWLVRNRSAIERFGRPLTSRGEFKRDLIALRYTLSSLSRACVYLPILQPTGHLLSNCGDFSGLVKAYNMTMREVVKEQFLNFTEKFDYKENVLADGYHLTRKGHEYIAGLIYGSLSCAAG